MPINTFWTANDKIPIAQKRVSVPSENGLEYSAGQKIMISVPPTIQYIQPKESYLQLDVKLALPANASGVTANGIPTRLMLDEALGAQVLIRDLRIYSGGVGNVLLEEYQNYNIITALKYDYETNDTLRAKRALTEGSLNHSVECRGTCGTTTSQQNDCVTNPYFKGHSGSSISASFQNDDFQTVKCLLPINTGIFQNDKVFPVLMTEGLKLEIILERDTNVFRNLDQSLENRKLNANPIFHSINGSDDAPTNASTAGTFASFYVTRDNNMTGTPQVPFVIGEKLGFVKTDGTDETTFSADPIISQIDYDSGAGDFGLVKITCDPAINFATNPPLNRQYVLYSRSDIGSPTYTVSNVELILQQLTMPDGYTRKMMSMMKEGGSMNYDFLSFTNYKYSQLSSDTVANIRLPFNQSRAKAVLCIPVDATNRDADDSARGDGTYLINSEAHDVANYSDRSGLVGITDNLTNYQFFYDGKLNPSRKVSTAKLSAKNSIDQQPLIELEKALAQSKIIPYSFRSFQSNFCVGRALSLQDGVYDTRGKDFNLQVEYDTAGDFNHLWNCWISHVRRIVFAGGGIQLLV